ncbi:MAG: hypothetical protein O3B09_01165 [Proteobacteria bacterium]|nr:hypothetical protein [Pseudomonadota bacterium]
MRLRAIYLNTPSNNDPESKRRVVVLMDVKGTLAYSGDYFDGNETLSDGTCIDGFRGKKEDSTYEKNGQKHCGGKNTNDDKGLAGKWRTVFMVPYILDSVPNDNINGYYDMNGNFFQAQENPKFPLRIGPPNLQSIANVQNSVELFEPVVFVKNVRTIRGGGISTQAGSQFGKTDFHYPEIEVQFGSTSQLMSLGANYLQGNTEGFDDSPGEMTLVTTENGVEYSAKLSLEKDYNSSTKQPTLCLYRTFFNQGLGTKKLIKCVERQQPQINSTVQFTGFTANADNLVNRKAVISASSENLYNIGKIKLKLMIDQGANLTPENCNGDDNCSDIEITLEDPNLDGSRCDFIEEHKFCSQREECSRLYNECADNMINLHNAEIAGQSTASFEQIKEECNGELLDYCNKKWGITDSTATDIFSQTASDVTGRNEYAYGWWNEICIHKGFEDRLYDVVAYQVNDGEVQGKCVVNGGTYITDNNPNTNCDYGGVAPYCICQEYDPNDPTALESTGSEPPKTTRKQTPREAGLCIDLPIPNFCPAIDYTPVNNTDPNDPHYAQHSVDRINYDTDWNADTTNIHLSHYFRTNGDTSGSNMILRGHGEFPSTLGGIDNVKGQCNGFWTYPTDPITGIQIKPILNCSIAGVWGDINNVDCIRHECPAVTTDGLMSVEVDGVDKYIYKSNYAAGDEDDADNNIYMGISEGYALWPSYQKTNDKLESVTATACLTGFKPVGSSLNAAQTAFTGGTSPSRNCDQLGDWNSVSNACQRVTCPAVNVDPNDYPDEGSAEVAYYTAISEIGGASFPETTASRSVDFIETTSIATGICDEEAGFKNSGGVAPTRECNHLGQWGAVITPCTTECSAISDTIIANSAGHGFAFWPAIENVPIGGSVDTDAASCIDGYIPSPYSPTSQPLSTDPEDLAAPSRSCTSNVTSSGVSNDWSTEVLNPCVNQCPGADIDSRIGVGITKHNIANSSGTLNSVDVSWPSTDFGGDRIEYVCEGSSFDASLFNENRTDNCYFLKRVCGNGTNGSAKGVWQEPIPICIANDGALGNATYKKGTNEGINNYVELGQSVSGQCLSDKSYYADPAPSRTCQYSAGNNQAINRLELKLTNDDCQEMTCRITNGQTFGNSKYTGPTQDISVSNTPINLSCANSDYGRAITGETNTAEASEYCGIPQGSITDRSNFAPSVKCEFDPDATSPSGKFSAVANDCEPCRACSQQISASCVHSHPCKVFGNSGTFSVSYNKLISLNNGQKGFDGVSSSSKHCVTENHSYSINLTFICYDSKLNVTQTHSGCNSYSDNF